MEAQCGALTEQDALEEAQVAYNEAQRVLAELSGAACAAWSDNATIRKLRDTCPPPERIDNAPDSTLSAVTQQLQAAFKACDEAKEEMEATCNILTELQTATEDAIDNIVSEAKTGLQALAASIANIASDAVGSENTPSIARMDVTAIEQEVSRITLTKTALLKKGGSAEKIITTALEEIRKQHEAASNKAQMSDLGSITFPQHDESSFMNTVPGAVDEAGRTLDGRLQELADQKIESRKDSLCNSRRLGEEIV